MPIDKEVKPKATLVEATRLEIVEALAKAHPNDVYSNALLRPT